jgi:hypothetical protein
VVQAQAHTRSQSISSLGSAVKADLEAAAALREAVLHLVRSGETALHTFKRAHAWREAAKVGERAGSMGGVQRRSWMAACLAPPCRQPACTSCHQLMQSSAPLTSQDISGTPVLPSQFLREAISGFRHRLGQHQAVVAELEQVLAVASSTGKYGSGCPAAGRLADLLWLLHRPTGV